VADASGCLESDWSDGMSDKVYEIHTVTDFLAVPLDRLPACLDDFTTWCAIAQLVIAEGNPSVKMLTDAFRWIDDGKDEQHIQVTMRHAAAE
jgi:hypothetical protein